MKTTKFFQNATRKWVLIDAKDKVLGRLATRIARILIGKTKAIYTPNSLCGDKVVVINAKYIRVTGNKVQQKIYDRYTGYPSGRKLMSLRVLQEKNPSKVIYLAVKGMLPKSNLGAKMLCCLKIYPEAVHDQQAQKPEPINV